MAKSNKIGPILTGTLKKLDNKNLYFISYLSTNWSVVMGMGLSCHSAPYKIQKNKLHVMVEDQSYANYMRRSEQSILSMIANLFQDEKIVTKIVFQVGDFEFFQPPKIPATTNNRIKAQESNISKEQQISWQKDLAVIENKNLRALCLKFRTNSYLKFDQKAQKNQ